jgi:type VI secretion system protein VasI
MKTKLFFLLLAAGIVFPQSFAQQTISKEDAAMACSLESTGEDRLRCYDTIFGTTPLIETPVSGTGDWNVNITADPLSDERRVTLQLLANSGNTLLASRTLVIRCNNGDLDLYVSWNDYLADNTDVTYRIGSSEPVRKNWSKSSNSQTTFFPGENIAIQEVIDEMANADQFIARILPYNSNPVTAIFNTAGLSNGLVPLRETCSYSNARTEVEENPEDISSENQEIVAIYQSTCFACHSTGAAGAPKLGDIEDWNSRMEKGLDQVMANVVRGINAMPPKGLCFECDNDTLKAVVSYMIPQ